MCDQVAGCNLGLIARVSLCDCHCDSHDIRGIKWIDDDVSLFLLPRRVEFPECCIVHLSQFCNRFVACHGIPGCISSVSSRDVLVSCRVKVSRLLFNFFSHSAGPAIVDRRIGVRCFVYCGSDWFDGSGWFGLELRLE